MDGPRHQPLAGAGLPGDEHRRSLVQRRDLAGPVEYVQDRLRFSHYLGERVVAPRPLR